MNNDLTDDSIYNNRWKSLIVISVIQLVLMLDATVVNVALPQIKSELSFTDGSLTWVVNAYFITAGSLLLFGGKLGDSFGVSLIFKIGIIVFAIFSLIAALSNSAEILIIGRAGQGVGEALASATGLAMISLLFPHGTERTKAFSIWAGVAGIGSIIGVLLSGFLTEYFSWRWVFGINIPVISILLIATLLFVPKFVNKYSAKIDMMNSIVLIFAVSIMALGIIGSSIETRYLLRAVLIVAGLMAIFTVLRRCKNMKNGIIPARLMNKSKRLYGYILIAIQASTSGALFYLGILFLQGTLKFSPMQSGLGWLPFCFGFFPGIFLSQFLTNKNSFRVAAFVGLIISAIGFVFFAVSMFIPSYWLGMLPAMVVTSIGFGCVAPVAQSLATAELSEDDAGAGAGISTTVQQLFQVAGVTIFTAIALNATQDNNHIFIGIHGYMVSFLICAALLLLGVFLVGSKYTKSTFNLS